MTIRFCRSFIIEITLSSLFISLPYVGEAWIGRGEWSFDPWSSIPTRPTAN